MGICLVATITDIRSRKVYNWLTFPAMILALVLNLMDQGWSGLGLSCFGLLVGGALFVPVFIFDDGMGAGDIKLMAVVGAFMGWKFSINAALYAVLIGGVLALIILLIHGELWESLKNIARFIRSLVIPKLAMEKLSKKHRLPYAVCIACGVLATLFLPPLLLF